MRRWGPAVRILSWGCRLQCASYTSYLILPSRGAATTLWGARGRDLLVERRGLPLAPHGRPVRRP